MKGQAAFEFMMTYGWAIIAVLSLVGVLGYFGLLSPTAFLPERCEIVVGFSCADSQVTTNAVTLHLVNTLGEKAFISKIEIVNPETLDILCTWQPPAAKEVRNGERVEQQIPCTKATGLPNAKANLRMKIAYAKGVPEFAHTLTGVLYARVGESAGVEPSFGLPTEPKLPGEEAEPTFGLPGTPTAPQ
ncbi:hypothetical protein HY639_04360 [Candidatus Woesearchaeota archaeon]|nr:hypothetical protein [Candidatus Woesearchaeota archaeon]